LNTAEVGIALQAGAGRSLGVEALLRVFL